MQGCNIYVSFMSGREGREEDRAQKVHIPIWGIIY